MNFKKLTAFAMTGFIFTFGFYQVAAAADGVYDSDATIEFTPGTGAPGIIDPTNPDEDFDKETPGNPQDDPTGDEGPLTLDYVSSVDFGIHEIDGKSAVYESTSLKPFIQVSDRRGTGAGWTVTAAINEFTNSEDEEPTLLGSILTFTNGEVVSRSSSDEPHATQEIKLSADETAAQVVSAGDKEGLGTWVNRWFPTEAEAVLNNNVKLEVSAGAATVGNHTAQITWSLTDAPGQ